MFTCFTNKANLKDITVKLLKHYVLRKKFEEKVPKIEINFKRSDTRRKMVNDTVTVFLQLIKSQY